MYKQFFLSPITYRDDSSNNYNNNYDNNDDDNKD